ncbi:PAS domain-containing protein [Candidatus Giovannonibacteria bacterium]|nr:PAS domain-containing protein [Candidatus Giovannonibacteria bacterium]
MENFRFSIRPNLKKIIAVFNLTRAVTLLALVLIIVAINAFWYIPSRNELNHSTLALYTTIASGARNQTTEFVKKHQEALQNIGFNILIEPHNLDKLFARFLKENPAIESVSVLGFSGQELAREDRNLLVTQEDLKYRLSDTAYQYARAGSLYVGPVFLSKIGEPLITVAAPLKVESDLFSEDIQVITADLNVRYMIDVVRDIKVGGKGLAYLVDSSGFLIAHPDVSLVLRRVNLLNRHIVLDVLAGQESSTFDSDNSYENFAGEKVFALGLPINIGSGWGALVEEPERDVFAPHRRTLFVASITLGIELLMVFILFVGYLNLIQTANLLASEKDQREAILNSLSDGVIEYDSGSKIILMNPRAEDLLGVKMRDIMGTPITPEILHTRPELRGVVEVMYPALAKYTSGVKPVVGSTARSMELHISQPELKLIVTMSQVMDENGENRSFLKILRDISREQLFARLRSEFVSIAAHQLRTPLSAIKWTLKLLLDGDAGPISKEQSDLLSRGYETNERMIKLVSDLLNAARIEEGRFGYNMKEIDLLQFMDEIVKTHSLNSQSKGVSLEFVKDLSDLTKIFIDPEKLSLALNNLLDNAIKYTAVGGKVVMKVAQKPQFLEISVSDNGFGIPEAEKKRVFSKFFRASNVVRRETEGTGLGLFIVRNIIKRHGGDISFDSVEGKGTTFTIALPLNKEDVPKEEFVPLEEFLETI